MNGVSPNPSGVLIRHMLRGDPKTAAAFLKFCLRDGIAAYLSNELPEFLENSYVSAELGDRYSDALLRTHLKTGEELLVYFLCLDEYDDQAVVYLEGYVVDILSERRRDRPSEPLPKVLPVMFYYGSEPWTSSADAVPDPSGPPVRSH